MVKLTDVKGIGPVKLKVLEEHKIKTVEALAAISLAELQKIPGFKGDLRARAVQKSAADCLRGKIDKQTSAISSNAQAAVEKVVKPKVVISPTVNQSETDKVKDKSKKKSQKNDKKKIKDKEKKKKNKDKKKNGKKKDKKKS
ncbi:MAG: helix-hairpin-helix domain-containing protein [Proteobacteria bacterium]|nr:helix-hairpin-helix domain-containing protein [Pseudomonadota bacterium]